MDDNTADTNSSDSGLPVDDGAERLVVGELSLAADAIDAGDPNAMLTSVHATVTRRRRRRNTVVGVAAAGVLVASGVVVANLVAGDDGDDLIVSAPVTEVPTTDAAGDSGEEAPPVTSVDAELGDGEAAETIEVPTGEPVPVRVVPASTEEVVDNTQTVDSVDIGQSHLLSWQDGFLSISTTFVPQPLPAELPPEIVDQFPAEVVDLFPDGLPATINEATQVLQDAGLLDEVSAILSENQDIYDAVYAEEAVGETTVRFSTDGREWTDVTADFPTSDNYWSHVSTTADRMVIVSESYAEDSIGASPRSLDVYSSTDLVDWSVHQIPLSSEPPPEEFGPRYSTYLAGFASTDTGFVAAVETHLDADPISWLPSEVRNEVLSSPYHNVGWGDDGITVEVFDVADEIHDNGESNPEPTTVYVYTWEELGFDGPPEALGESSAMRYVSTWDGQPTAVETAATGWMLGVDDQYVELGAEPRRSTNGIDWTPVELPNDELVHGYLETPRGVALMTSDMGGRTTLYEGDFESGVWTPVEVPGLPDITAVQSSQRNVALFQDVGDPVGGRPDPSFDAIGSVQWAEVDGYRYELTVTNTADAYSASYTVVDVESGELVLTESADGLSDDDEPFEYIAEDSFGGQSLVILDPASGDVLVSIPYEALTQELINSDGTTIDVSEPPATTVVLRDWEEPAVPNHWAVIAFDAGWVVEELPSDDETGRWPVGAAATDDIAVVAWSDGTFTRITPA